MQQAAQLLTGTHDFAAFSNGRTKKSTVRTVETIKINREDQLIQIQLTANSFLRHMPQLLAGTILTAGKEKKDRQNYADSRWCRISSSCLSFACIHPDGCTAPLIYPSMIFT